MPGCVQNGRQPKQTNIEGHIYLAPSLNLHARAKPWQGSGRRAGMQNELSKKVRLLLHPPRTRNINRSMLPAGTLIRSPFRNDRQMRVHAAQVKVTSCGTSSIERERRSKCNEDFLYSFSSHDACYYYHFEPPPRAAITAFILIPTDCSVLFKQATENKNQND